MEFKQGDVAVSNVGGFVSLVEIQRAPNNFFDVDLIRDLAEVFAKQLEAVKQANEALQRATAGEKRSKAKN